MCWVHFHLDIGIFWEAKCAASTTPRTPKHWHHLAHKRVCWNGLRAWITFAGNHWPDWSTEAAAAGVCRWLPEWEEWPWADAVRKGSTQGPAGGCAATSDCSGAAGLLDVFFSSWWISRTGAGFSRPDEAKSGLTNYFWSSNLQNEKCRIGLWGFKVAMQLFYML